MQILLWQILIKKVTLVLWLHGRESLVLFLDYINTLDTTQKIKFTMDVAEPGDYLEFLDLKT